MGDILQIEVKPLQKATPPSLQPTKHIFSLYSGGNCTSSEQLWCVLSPGRASSATAKQGKRGLPGLPTAPAGHIVLHSHIQVIHVLYT